MPRKDPWSHHSIRLLAVCHFRIVHRVHPVEGTCSADHCSSPGAVDRLVEDSLTAAKLRSSLRSVQRVEVRRLEEDNMGRRRSALVGGIVEVHPF